MVSEENSVKEKISVVIPCYNSEQNIENVIKTDIQIFEDLCIEHYEFVLVNDASKDDTWKVIKKISIENDAIIAVDLAKNCGQHGAIMAGFRQASGDYVVVSDDDGQTQMEVIGEMLNKLKQGYDVVTTEWLTKSKRSLVRRIGTKMSNVMNEVLLKAPKGIPFSIFFVARKFVIDEVIRYDNPYPHIPGLILRTSHNIGIVKTEQLERQNGVSGYSFRKLFSLWMNGFTAFSVVPLRVATYLGGCSAFLGFAYGIYIIIRRLLFSNIAVGWSSTIAILLFMSGLILCVLGMIGEYVGRIYMCINNSPQYVVKQVVKSGEEQMK